LGVDERAVERGQLRQLLGLREHEAARAAAPQRERGAIAEIRDAEVVGVKPPRKAARRAGARHRRGAHRTCHHARLRVRDGGRDGGRLGRVSLGYHCYSPPVIPGYVVYRWMGDTWNRAWSPSTGKLRFTTVAVDEASSIS